MPTDEEKQREKEAEQYEDAYKKAYKYDEKNPKDSVMAKHPLKSKIDELAEAEALRIAALKRQQGQKQQYAGRYIPTKTMSLHELVEYNAKMYPQNTKVHDLKIADREVPALIELLWHNNARFGGPFSPIIRQLIAIVKAARVDAGVKMEVVDGGRMVRLSDPQGHSITRKPLIWEPYEYPDLFSGARKL